MGTNPTRGLNESPPRLYHNQLALSLSAIRIVIRVPANLGPYRRYLDLAQSISARGDKGLRVYIPSHSMQGDDVPLYVLWNPDKKVTIEVLIPEGLAVKEAYNVEPSSARESGSFYTYDKFETNGYLGLVLETTKYESAKVTKEISVKVKSNSWTKTCMQSLCLFRPQVEITDKPDSIRVEVKDGNIQVRNPIGLTNAGAGTAIVGLRVLKGSNVTLGDPTGMGQFLADFWADVGDRMLRLRDKHPEYRKTIEGFLGLAEGFFQLQSKERKRARIILEELDKALDEDEKFREEFVSAILSAFFKYLSIITPMEAFVAFLSSITPSGILIVNPLQVVHLKSGRSRINAALQLTDLATNEYDELGLGIIEISTNEKCEVSVYQLFRSSTRQSSTKEECLEP